MKSVGSIIASEAQINVSNLQRAEATNRMTLLKQNDPEAAQRLINESEKGTKKTLVETLAEIYNNSAIDPQSRKIFIRNIAEGIPDSIIESLLIETGELNYWRRSKNQNGDLVSFGTAEYKNIDGVLKAIRLLNQFPIMGKKLDVSYSDKTKNLIGEFIEFKKAEIASRHQDQYLGDEEIENRLTEALCHNDDTITKKLQLMAEKFEIHKDKIQKSSIHDKGSIMACTEEKLGMFKQKYGLMNEKELNEVYAKEVVEWLGNEAKYQEEQQKILEEEKAIHKRKTLLIDEELKLRENDLLPKNERQEQLWNKSKQLRNKIITADRESKGEKINISMEHMASRRALKEDIRDGEQPLQNKVETRKRIKPEIIMLQSTGKNDRKFNDDLPRQTDINHNDKHEDYRNQRFNINLSIDGNAKTNKHYENGRGERETQLNKRLLEDDEEDHLVFEKKKIVSSETMKKLEKAAEINKHNEQNMEQALIKSAYKNQNTGKQNEARPSQ